MCLCVFILYLFIYLLCATDSDNDHVKVFKATTVGPYMEAAFKLMILLPRNMFKLLNERIEFCVSVNFLNAFIFCIFNLSWNFIIYQSI